MPGPILSSASIKTEIPAARLCDSKLPQAGEFKQLLLKPAVELPQDASSPTTRNPTSKPPFPKTPGFQERHDFNPPIASSASRKTAATLSPLPEE